MGDEAGQMYEGTVEGDEALSPCNENVQTETFLMISVKWILSQVQWQIFCKYTI